MSKKQPSLTAAHDIKNRWPALLPILLCACTFFSASLPVGTARAAELVEDDGGRWFEVEIILFAHNDPQALDAEQWPDIEGIELPLEDLQELRLPTDPEAESTDTENAETGTETGPENASPLTDVPAAETTADVADETPTGPVAFQLLDESEWRLTETARRLKRSSRFEPLLHIAWRQPTYELARARPVLIYNGMDKPLVSEEVVEEPVTVAEETASGETTPNNADDAFSEDLEPVYATEADALIGPPNPRLIGTIKLSVARYLHLAADLVYRVPETQQYAELVPDFDLWYDRPYPTLYEPQGPAYRLEEWQAIRGFRMLESRRMRSKVVHYLDHPFFGMIVLITPVEAPEAEEDSESAAQ